MVRTVMIFLAFAITLPATAALYDAYQIDNINENENSGLRFYAAGEYEKAYSLLKETAAQGMKQSQYILGFMLMKGEGVQKDMLAGLAFVGLATEAQDKEWQETFDRLYSALNDQQRSLVDARIEQYREKFGATVQGVTCARSAVVGKREIKMVCRKSTGTYPDHVIELP